VAKSVSHIKTVSFALFGLIVIAPFQNCGSSHSPGSDSLASNNVTIEVDPTLNTAALQILRLQCSGCHQNVNSGNISQIMDIYYLYNKQLITPGDSTKGRLLGSIADGSMPPGGVVSAANVQTLKDWIDSMKIVAGGDGGNLPPVDELPPLEPTFTSIKANILDTKCLACHGSQVAKAGVRYDTHALTLRTVNLENPDESKLYTECLSGSMPEAPYPKLTATELSTLLTWLQLGAKND
jgi:hypothetical protein